METRPHTLPRLSCGSLSPRTVAVDLTHCQLKLIRDLLAIVHELVRDYGPTASATILPRERGTTQVGNEPSCFVAIDGERDFDTGAWPPLVYAKGSGDKRELVFPDKSPDDDVDDCQTYGKFTAECLKADNDTFNLYARADTVFPKTDELLTTLKFKTHRRVYFSAKDLLTVGKSIFDHDPEELQGARGGSKPSKRKGKRSSKGAKSPTKAKHYLAARARVCVCCAPPRPPITTFLFNPTIKSCSIICAFPKSVDSKHMSTI
jgi:hypothetical protein